MQMKETYKTEKLARAAAERGLKMALSMYEKEDCKTYTDGNAVVLVHPDRFRGTVTLRYEW